MARSDINGSSVDFMAIPRFWLSVKLRLSVRYIELNSMRDLLFSSIIRVDNCVNLSPSFFEFIYNAILHISF